MKWSKPTTALRTVARESGLLYSISPGARGWVLRTYYEDHETETLYVGEIGACKLAAERHLRAQHIIASVMRNYSRTKH